MKARSMKTMFICMVMILSIFTPTVMGKKDLESKRTDTYRDYILKGIGFKESNIHSELLDKIEKKPDTEVGIIVTVEKGKDKANVENALTKAKGKKIKYHRLADAYSATVKAREIKEIARVSDVDRVYPDFKVRTYLDDSVPIIGANKLWSRYNGSGIKIAVIDTGIDSNHPDLKNKVIDQVSFVSDEPYPEDGFGHGTHVAGIIAGNGAASGGKYKGVASGASLMNVKVLGKYGYGTASAVMSGIEYAVDHGANVISMSIGAMFWPADGTDPVAMTANAAVDAGVVVVAAAGNSGAPFLIISPASGEKVIAVGATTKKDKIAIYSSMGPTWDHRIKPEIVAPGGDYDIYPDPAGLGIVSAKAAGSVLERWLPEYMVDKYYMALSGTSMATPHVSGAAALMLQANPSMTPMQVKNQLMNTGMDIGYDPITQGAGRINATLAVENKLNIAPASLSYIAKPGEYMQETLTISNSGKKKIEVYLSSIGGVDVKFQKDTITLNPGQTRKVKATLGVPAGATTGLHNGSIVIIGGGQYARVPILIDTHMTFVGGTSQFSDVINLKSSEFFSIGTNYYYFEVPQGVPGISATLTFIKVEGWVDLYLLDPDGEFVNYDWGWYGETEAKVSAANPKPGRWMLLVDSAVFEPMENIPITLTTNLNSLKLEPTSWIIPSIISSSVNQTFTLTNTGKVGKSVQVEDYIGVPNNSASGSFYGSVDYIYPYPPEPIPPNVHKFDIPMDASEYSLTMRALNNTAYLVACILDPNGMWVYCEGFGLWALPTFSIKVEDPLPGTWSVEVQAIYAETNTTEHYTGSYDVVSKDTSWIVSSPEAMFIPAAAQKGFTSTLTPPTNANGDYTGEITVYGGLEILKIPVSTSVGQSIPYPGDFTGDIKNKAWKYYNLDVNSSWLNASLGWDNINNDLDLFAFDPTGTIVASSTQTNTTNETVNISNPASGKWTIGVYGYEVTGVQQFWGTVS